MSCDDEDYRDRPEFREGYGARVADPHSVLENPYCQDLNYEGWAAYRAGDDKARDDLRGTVGGPYAP